MEVCQPTYLLKKRLDVGNGPLIKISKTTREFTSKTTFLSLKDLANLIPWSRPLNSVIRALQGLNLKKIAFHKLTKLIYDNSTTIMCKGSIWITFKPTYCWLLPNWMLTVKMVFSHKARVLQFFFNNVNLRGHLKPETWVHTWGWREDQWISIFPNHPNCHTKECRPIPRGGSHFLRRKVPIDPLKETSTEELAPQPRFF